MKNLLGYVLIGVIKLLSRVSLARAQATGQWLGRRMMKKRTRAREVARVNIGLCYPELSAAEQNSLVEQSLQHSGMTGAEMGPMWGYSHERLMGMIRSVHNGELFDDAIAANEGVLLMVPHLGNW
ncbi:MAG: lauroyl acyltransferase, partial [Pseudomonadota bacterium]|nr:lauroyl acyltransferase [Pseudomonadota bacterium]